MSGTAVLLAGAADRAERWLRAAEAGGSGIALVPHRPGMTLDPFRYCLLWRPVPGLAAAMPNLRAVFAMGAGIEGILADETLPPRLPIVRMAEPGLTQAMATYALWQVLRHHRRFWEIEEAQERHDWQQLDYPAPWQRRIGILGLGVLGRAIAELLLAFDFKISGWSRSRKRIEGVDCFAGPAELAAFIADCDILLCLLPLTAETEGILNRDLFAHMKQGASLINMARGGHLVEDDLLAALASGRLAAATLDVFATEPLPPDHPFWSHQRIFVTPHSAGFTEPATGLRAIARQIANFESGGGLDNLVDRRRGY